MENQQFWGIVLFYLLDDAFIREYYMSMAVASNSFPINPNSSR